MYLSPVKDLGQQMAFYLKDCTVNECDRKQHAKLLCRKHYQLWKKHGNTDGIQHGRRSEPEYKVWAALRQRCNNPNNKAYEYYGGRGITVAKEWDNYVTFIEHIGQRPSPKHTIDRINNDGNYEPGNVHWVLFNEQNYNKRYRSAYRGVYKHGKAWIAKIQENGKDIYLGTFKSADDAAKAWNKTAVSLRGNKAKLNELGVGYGVL